MVRFETIAFTITTLFSAVGCEKITPLLPISTPARISTPVLICNEGMIVPGGDMPYVYKGKGIYEPVDYLRFDAEKKRTVVLLPGFVKSGQTTTGEDGRFCKTDWYLENPDPNSKNGEPVELYWRVR